ncbi:hypothetical protein T265_00216 [Opisthorchis viverrini]|uniref:Uncharacterized protein n=1 Tax=Opisthorchis viverrini TaxID=6198 RepID=A0A075A2T3_OPIVI|nr:hypothetical protein T265_00216 [Opisthorchis viverrini]KER34028.1 hypothetical protein T265_00216 [Opisthorchis viverrini]
MTASTGVANREEVVKSTNNFPVHTRRVFASFLFVFEPKHDIALAEPLRAVHPGAASAAETHPENSSPPPPGHKSLT